MSRPLLILRPEPGAGESAERARALGLEAVTAPLFAVRPLAWAAPDPRQFDGVLVTSANAARHAGPALARFAHLPCYAVGEASAAATRAAGFGDVRTGPSDGAAAVRMARADGAARLFHPCGRDHVELGAGVASVPVYAAEAVAALPAAAADALARRAVAALHSPRAAALFAALVPAKGGVEIAAISAAAAAAAGGGWRSVHVAAAPRDGALLELAAKLCQNERDLDERTL